MQNPNPVGECASCGDVLDPTAAFWLYIGTPNPVAMCAECAETHLQLYGARDSISEAERIIKTHQTWLDSRVTL